VTRLRMCPDCGSSEPEDNTYCPSTPDKCGGCETCDHPFHAQPPVEAVTTSTTTQPGQGKEPEPWTPQEPNR
jgi:hypothetical protein